MAWYWPCCLAFITRKGFWLEGRRTGAHLAVLVVAEHDVLVRNIRELDPDVAAHLPARVARGCNGRSVKRSEGFRARTVRSKARGPHPAQPGAGQWLRGAESSARRPLRGTLSLQLPVFLSLSLSLWGGGEGGKEPKRLFRHQQKRK